MVSTAENSIIETEHELSRSDENLIVDAIRANWSSNDDARRLYFKVFSVERDPFETAAIARKKPVLSHMTYEAVPFFANLFGFSLKDVLLSDMDAKDKALYPAEWPTAEMREFSDCVLTFSQRHQLRINRYLSAMLTSPGVNEVLGKSFPRLVDWAGALYEIKNFQGAKKSPMLTWASFLNIPEGETTAHYLDRFTYKTAYWPFGFNKILPASYAFKVSPHLLLRIGMSRPTWAPDWYHDITILGESLLHESIMDKFSLLADREQMYILDSVRLMTSRMVPESRLQFPQEGGYRPC